MTKTTVAMGVYLEPSTEQAINEWLEAQRITGYNRRLYVDHTTKTYGVDEDGSRFVSAAHYIAYEFDDADDATLFKLTFGGAA